LLIDGIDPIAARDARRAQEALGCHVQALRRGIPAGQPGKLEKRSPPAPMGIDAENLRLPRNRACAGIVEHHGADTVQNVHGVRDTDRSCGPWPARRQAYPESARHLTHGAHLSPWECEQLRAEQSTAVVGRKPPRPRARRCRYFEIGFPGSSAHTGFPVGK
jgi:hypothetical protein